MVKIVWDEPKRLANLDKHGLDFADLDETFFDSALVIPSASRRQALGRDRPQHARRHRCRVRAARPRGRQHHQHAPRQQERKKIL